MVDTITITIRTAVALIMLQIMTGTSRSSVVKTSSNALAVRLIKVPEYIYTFGSVDMS